MVTFCLKKCIRCFPNPKNITSHVEKGRGGGRGGMRGDRKHHNIMMHQHRHAPSSSSSSR